MRNKLMLAGITLTGLMFAVLGTKASAQYEPLSQKMITVHVGAFFPSDTDSRDKEGDTWIAAGAEYGVYKLPSNTDMNEMITVSLDYYGSGSLYAVPLLVNFKGMMTNGFFFGAGVGVGFNKHVNTRVGNVYTTESKTDLAWQLNAGYEFSHGQTPIFGEVRYYGTSTSGLDGFGVLVGARF